MIGKEEDLIVFYVAGQGRNPCVNDLTTILLVTDGTELTSPAGVSQSLQLNGPAPLGADLAVQLYRWDQRVFATVLRIPSVSAAVLERSGPIPQNAPISGAQSAVAMDANISSFCEFTGGKCFVATNLKVLMQHIEVTASRLPPCVIVSFDHMSQQGSALPPQVHLACQRKMLLVRGGQAQGQGHWPIPEAYWPDPSHLVVPPREPHPVIAYKPMDADPYIPSNFVFDKYEIESNPITGFLLKAQMGACWQVYIRNSKAPNHNYGDPFG
jgi:integrator complex subunit 6